MKIITKGIELKEVQEVILTMHKHPIVGDIIPPAWHQNFPVCGDIRHGQRGRTKRKGPPRRSLQHYLNMLVLAHILSWYRPKPWDGDHGPDEKAITKRFDDGLLKINLKRLATDWQCSINQISAALSYLEEIGAISRAYSKVDFFGTEVKKAVFVVPVMSKIAELSQRPEGNKCLQKSSLSLGLAREAQNRRSLKRKMATASSAESPTPQAQNGHSVKRNLSYSEPKASNTTTTSGVTEGDGGALSAGVSPSATRGLSPSGFPQPHESKHSSRNADHEPGPRNSNQDQESADGKHEREPDTGNLASESVKGKQAAESTMGTRSGNNADHGSGSRNGKPGSESGKGNQDPESNSTKLSPEPSDANHGPEAGKKSLWLKEIWCKRYRQFFGKEYRLSPSDNRQLEQYCQDNPEEEEPAFFYPVYMAWRDTALAGVGQEPGPPGKFDRWFYRRRAQQLGFFLKFYDNISSECGYESKTWNWEKDHYRDLLCTIKSGRDALLESEDDSLVERVPVQCPKCQHEFDSTDDAIQTVCPTCGSVVPGQMATS